MEQTWYLTLYWFCLQGMKLTLWANQPINACFTLLIEQKTNFLTCWEFYFCSLFINNIIGFWISELDCSAGGWVLISNPFIDTHIPSCCQVKQQIEWTCFVWAFKHQESFFLDFTKWIQLMNQNKCTPSIHKN